MNKFTVTAFALALGASAASAECLDAGYEVIPNTGGTACHFVGNFDVTANRTGDGSAMEQREVDLVFNKDGELVKDKRNKK